MKNLIQIFLRCLQTVMRKLHLKKWFLLFCLSSSLAFSEKDPSQNLQKNFPIHRIVATRLDGVKKNPHFLLDFHLESSLALIKNNLLKPPHNWFAEIPYTEIEFYYAFSKNHSVKMIFDIAYQSENWIYSVEDLFLQQEFSFENPLTLQTGYFHYPVSYFAHNENEFFKTTLTQKTLFPFKNRSLGVLLRGDLPQSFYWKLSLHPSFSKRETDGVQKMESHPVTTVSLIHRQPGKDVFVSYFQKKFFLEEQMHALGFGSDLSFTKGLWSFNFRGELWGVKKTKPYQNLLTYYLSPRLQWQRFSLYFLFGGVHHYLLNGRGNVLEYILKTEFRLTDFLFLNAEWLKEQDTLVKKEELIFSLKTVF